MAGSPTENDEGGSPDSFTPLGFTEAVKQTFAPISSRLGRLSGAGAGAPGQGSPGKTRPRARPAFGTEEERRAVTYIDKRESWLGYFFGVLVLIAAGFVYAHFHHYTNPKRLHYATEVRHAAPEVLIAGIVLGLIILAATISRRRAALGFGFLLAGIGLLQVVGIAALVYLGIGVWMVFRAMKRPRRDRASPGAKSGATGPSRTSTSAGGRSDGSGPPARARPSSGSRAAPSKQASTGRAGQASGPSASKRYTPPKPHKHPVPAKKQESDGEPSNRLAAWLRK